MEMQENPDYTEEPLLSFDHGDVLIKDVGVVRLFPDDNATEMLTYHRWSILGVTKDGKDVLETVVDVELLTDPAPKLAEAISDFMTNWFLGPNKEKKG